ncbi:phage tail tube protein [Sneathiella sp.]|uniref:phage tail tube protein n=1 Tax=Sneathiella sp. TaxID=1964365 RepID=UPI002FE3C37B
MSKQFTGRAHIAIAGKEWASSLGATCTFPGVRRTEEETDRGSGYKEQLVSGKISATFRFGKGDSLKELAELPPATVTFTCDTGQVYIFSDAVRLGDPPTLNSDGGTVDMEFMSNDVEEVKG